jgi:hypothetical protein
MKTPLKITLAAALPLVSVLWLTPPANAHDTSRSHKHRHSWSDASSYRDPSTGRSIGSYRDPSTGLYTDRERRHRDGSSWEDGKKHRKYHKAMNRLSRQEREARTKAYRRYEGDRRDPRYWERLSEIDRRYDHKRDKVERNLRHD